MFFSTKGRYGLKAMVDLAIEYGNGPVSALSLAQRQDISTSYLDLSTYAAASSGVAAS